MHRGLGIRYIKVSETKGDKMEIVIGMQEFDSVTLEREREYTVITQERKSGAIFIEKLYYDLEGDWFMYFIDGIGRFDFDIYNIKFVQVDINYG